MKILISCLLADIQGLTATAIVVGSVLSAIGMVLIFLLRRFIKGFDDGIANNATAIDGVKKEVEALKQSIIFNVGEREKQIAGVDRKIYDATIAHMERLRGIDDRLKDQDLKLQELKWLTLNEGKE